MEDFLKLKRAIERLETYKTGGNPILSLYLQDRGFSGCDLVKNFHELLIENTPAETAVLVENEILNIYKYLWHTYKVNKTNSGIVFFTGKDIWEVVDHRLTIPSQIVISNKFYLKPLKEAAGTFLSFINFTKPENGIINKLYT